MIHFNTNPQGWDLKKGLFSFYPLYDQSELYLVKHVQKIKSKNSFKIPTMSAFQKGEVRDRYGRGTGCLRDYKGF